MQKCNWCLGNPVYEAYHDTEWGIPVYDSRSLFEALSLEAFMAGLSWITILKRRDYFREAFDNFQAHIIVDYTDDKIQELINNQNIIRHKGKILATINNASLFLEIEKTRSFSDFIWNYVHNKPIINHFEEMSQMPAFTDLSVKIAKDLKKMGFKFCGATTIYAFMQAVGMVNDHIASCDYKYIPS
jgi:DNA-3-methyladenine glycosylase I